MNSNYVSNKRYYRKFLNSWRLKNKLLNDQWIIEEIMEDNQQFLHENENTTYQDLLVRANTVIRGEVICILCLHCKTPQQQRRKQRSQGNQLSIHFKLLENCKKPNPKW
jgi:hypothetical protein